jgi:hypothetical protein
VTNQNELDGDFSDQLKGGLLKCAHDCHLKEQAGPGIAERLE